MAKKDQLEILNRGVEVWNQWRFQNESIDVDLRDANLVGADLTRFNFYKVDLTGANLKGANLEHAILSFAYFSNADFSNSNLSSANMMNSHSFQTEYNKANLQEANLEDADFSNADFVDSNLCDAKLSRANFTDARLIGATLCRADLWAADLTNSKLDSVNLTSADLRSSDFTHADLTNTDFSDTKLGWTKLGDVDLSLVKGLNTVLHYGPSTIGIDTIYRSNGKIPTAFLRGAGVPDIFLSFMSSLTATPIDFYSCFISYSSKDHSFAERLNADLQDKGVRCWFAPEDLRIGEKTRMSIDDSIRRHDKLLLILSKHSISSDWVEKEVETALEEERKQKRTILFPIRLDDTVIKIDSGWPADIRRMRNIGDFRRWKNHDSYQKAFNRLLSNLKSEDYRPSGA